MSGQQFMKSCRHRRRRRSVFPRRGDPCHLRPAPRLGRSLVSGSEPAGRTRRPPTPRRPAPSPDGRAAARVEPRPLCPPLPLLRGPRRALLSSRLWGGRRSPAGGAGAGRAPRHPLPQPRGAGRAGARTDAHPRARTPAAHPGAPPSPPPGRGPARRHSRLRRPACVYNFVPRPRPPSSWKGGGGMWRAAARRPSGASSGGPRRRPERLSLAEVARPLLGRPRARVGSCVPPRP